MSAEYGTPRGSLSTLRASNVSNEVPNNAGNSTYTHNTTGMKTNNAPNDYHVKTIEVESTKAPNNVSRYGMSSNVGTLIIWFFVIFIASWLVLYATKPSIVLRKDSREVDTGKVLLGSAIISLIVIIIIWLIKGCTTKKW